MDVCNLTPNFLLHRVSYSRSLPSCKNKVWMHPGVKARAWQMNGELRPLWLRSIEHYICPHCPLMMNINYYRAHEGDSSDTRHWPIFFHLTLTFWQKLILVDTGTVTRDSSGLPTGHSTRHSSLTLDILISNPSWHQTGLHNILSWHLTLTLPFMGPQLQYRIPTCCHTAHTIVTIDLIHSEL